MFKCLVLNNRNKYICFYMLKILLSSNKIVPEKSKPKTKSCMNIYAIIRSKIQTEFSCISKNYTP